MVLVAALGAGLAYGLMAWRNRRKTPATEAARDAATRRGYDQDDANVP